MKKRIQLCLYFFTSILVKISIHVYLKITSQYNWNILLSNTYVSVTLTQLLTPQVDKVGDVFMRDNKLPPQLLTVTINSTLIILILIKWLVSFVNAMWVISLSFTNLITVQLLSSYDCLSLQSAGRGKKHYFFLTVNQHDDIQNPWLTLSLLCQFLLSLFKHLPSPFSASVHVHLLSLITFSVFLFPSCSAGC